MTMFCVEAHFAFPPEATLRERLLLARRAAWRAARIAQRNLERDL